MDLRSYLPIAVGLFAVLAAACNWDWFFGQATQFSPLRLVLSEVWVRRVVRAVVAAMGLAVAVIASLYELGYDV